RPRVPRKRSEPPAAERRGAPADAAPMPILRNLGQRRGPGLVGETPAGSDRAPRDRRRVVSHRRSRRRRSLNQPARATFNLSIHAHPARERPAAPSLVISAVAQHPPAVTGDTTPWPHACLTWPQMTNTRCGSPALALTGDHLMAEKSWLDRALSPFADVRAGEGATAVLMLVNIFLLLI